MSSVSMLIQPFLALEAEDLIEKLMGVRGLL
jgi:hypothetical protein